MGGRTGPRLALALALIAAATATATAGANSPGSTDELRLTTRKPGASTGVFATEIFNARYKNGQLKPLRRSLIGFPKGTRFDALGWYTCRATDAELKSEGMSACPEKSKIGHGHAETESSGAPFQVGPVGADVTVYGTPTGSLLVFSQGDAYLSHSRVIADGRFQRTRPPANCVVVTDTPPCENGEFVARSLTVDIPAHQRRVKGRLHRLITTPRHCTRSGRWWFFDKHTFADGSFDKFVNRPRCE
ncbi:MAG TPA: hypothetical protein VJT75_04990 [Thermoleophilaceae bacterium]|nr:hypothetical protein [Thermoleophilaceae bacterium]